MAQYTKDPVEHSEYEAMPLITDARDPFAPLGLRSRLREDRPDTLRIGPLEKVYLFWIVGASCDGCTIAVSGATHPRVEDLLEQFPAPRLERTDFGFSPHRAECRASRGQAALPRLKDLTVCVGQEPQQLEGCPAILCAAGNGEAVATRVDVSP